MYLILLTLPLFSSIISGLLGRKIGQIGSFYISSISISIAALLSILAFYEVGINGSPITLTLTNWIDSEILEINWGLYIDSLTVSMTIIVLIISACVHFYAIDYMNSDPHTQRFFSYLSLFTFFMLILILADNFLFLFIGWEGVGVCSYLLINFWFTRLEANKSAILAILMNRVGDWGFSIGIYFIFLIFGNLDFSSIFAISHIINDENIISFICILLFIGAMAKSAQLGLNTWLPQAMEGPTPVSALLHAATMVTAGVYLLMRCSPLLEYSDTILAIITLMGSCTALFAASIALVHNDIKKVIAYSTMSQLGYTFLACGISQYDIAIFHIVNHAFFKALLFMSAGAVLHALNDEQNTNKMGGLIHMLPFTYTVMLTGSLSLMALPFLTGYYSKDLIIETSYGQYLLGGSIGYWLGTLTAFLTSIYSAKILILTFIGTPNGPLSNYKHSHEPSYIMSYPLIILSIFSIFFGYIFKDLFIGLGTDFWMHSLFMIPSHINIIDTEFSLPILYKFLPIIFSLFGIILAFIIYFFFSTYFYMLYIKFKSLRTIYIYLSNSYWLDSIYEKLVLYSAFNFGHITNKIIDKGIIEVIGPYGLSNLFYNITILKFSKLDLGIIPIYAIYIIFGLFYFFFFILFLQNFKYILFFISIILII